MSVLTNPNITIVPPPSNDPVIAMALRHVMQEFGSYSAIPANYSYSDDSMVLAVQSVSLYVEGLEWYVITAVPSSSFYPNFLGKSLGSVATILLIGACCVMSAISAHRQYSAAEVRTSDDGAGSDSGGRAQKSRANKEGIVVSLIFFFGGVLTTMALLGIWIAGQRALVEDGVTGIAASVSTRVGQYIQELIAIPTLVNDQNAAFGGFPALPTSSLSSGSNSSLIAIEKYLIATCSAASMIVPNHGVDVAFGMMNGAMIKVHSDVIVNGDSRSLWLSYSDAWSGGHTVTYPLDSLGQVNMSAEVEREAFVPQAALWYTQAELGNYTWSPLTFATSEADDGSKPLTISQSSVYRDDANNVSLVFAVTLVSSCDVVTVAMFRVAVRMTVITMLCGVCCVQYVTSAEFQARFGQLPYNASSYVIDSSLGSQQVVMASVGDDASCDVNGAVRLEASNSTDPEISQIASTLSSFVLSENSTRCSSGLCVSAASPLFVGVGIAKTQIIINVVSDVFGVSWSSVTAVILTSYLRTMHSWHALVYCFSVGMVVAVTMSATWGARFAVDVATSKDAQRAQTRAVLVMIWRLTRRLAACRCRGLSRADLALDLSLLPSPPSSPAKTVRRIDDEDAPSVVLVSARRPAGGDTSAAPPSSASSVPVLVKQATRESLWTAPNSLEKRRDTIKRTSRLLTALLSEKATSDVQCTYSAALLMRNLDLHFRKRQPVATRPHYGDGGSLRYFNDRAQAVSTVASSNGIFFGVDPHALSPEERAYQLRRVRVYESARRMLARALSGKSQVYSRICHDISSGGSPTAAQNLWLFVSNNTVYRYFIAAMVWLHLCITFMEAPRPISSGWYASVALHFIIAFVILFNALLHIYWRRRLDGVVLRTYITQAVIALIYIFDGVIMSKIAYTTGA